jgi:hypothetical protein
MMLDEHEDEKNQIKSPIKRYGSTRKVYMFNSEYKRFRVPKLLTSDSSLRERDDRTRGNDLAGAGNTCFLLSVLNVRNALRAIRAADESQSRMKVLLVLASAP